MKTDLVWRVLKWTTIVLVVLFVLSMLRSCSDPDSLSNQHQRAKENFERESQKTETPPVKVDIEDSLLKSEMVFLSGKSFMRLSDGIHYEATLFNKTDYNLEIYISIKFYDEDCHLLPVDITKYPIYKLSKHSNGNIRGVYKPDFNSVAARTILMEVMSVKIVP